VRLLLVRHGESICITKGIVGGHRGCTGLTDRGFAQARALRDRLAAEGFTADVLLASTLPRARQTAEVLGEALGVEPACHAELCEHVPGEIDGNLWETWERFDPVAELDRPLSPGGESTREFLARVRGLLERVASEHDGRTVVAATHGGVVWASMRVLLGMTANPWIQTDFTSVTEWRYEGGGWRLARTNDVAHLAGTDLLVTN
jgi:probable phosphoglycerate mutase